MTWQQRCIDAGGVPRVFPKEFGGRAGDPACRFTVAPGAGNAGTDFQNDYRDGRLNFSERLARSIENVKIAKDKAAGKVVEKIEDVREATGLDKGALGILGKALGVPPVLVLGLGLLVGFAFLRNAVPGAFRSS